jgi:Flp pilus assembly protein protease CpaA
VLTDIQISGITTITLCILLASAVVTDIRVNRITNQMVLLVLSLGLLSQAALYGLSGVASWLGGVSIGFVIFLPFYLRKAMGAGDVKLMAAVGGVFGYKVALIVTGFSLIAGLPLVLLLLVYRYIVTNREMPAPAARTDSGYVNFFKLTKLKAEDFLLSARKQEVPFAAAIAGGAFGGLLWVGNLQQLAVVLSS